MVMFTLTFMNFLVSSVTANFSNSLRLFREYLALVSELVTVTNVMYEGSSKCKVPCFIPAERILH
jgi:hypothetical protein